MRSRKVISLFLGLFCVSAACACESEVYQPKAQKENYAHKAKVVALLLTFQLKDIAIVDMPFDSAIGELSTLLKKAGLSPVNYVVQHSGAIVADDPFWEEDYEPEPYEKVTLKSKRMSYLEALDRLCADADYSWEVIFRDGGNGPIISVAPRIPKQGEQSVPPKSDRAGG